MQLPKLFLTALTLTATAILATTTPAVNSGCEDACGIDGAQCVNWFSNDGCPGDDKLGRFKVQKCDKTCYSVEASFASLYVCGDGFYGTSCKVYSDDNCQNELGQTPNEVTAFASGCSNFVGKSFVCLYQC